MKAHLADLVREQPVAQAPNLVREYLQAQILASLQRAGAMSPLAFHGGTALRFLYAIDRYSEDLDFALERAGRAYDLRRYLQAVRVDLEAQAYSVDLKINDRKVVHNAFVRFPGFLFELGLSPHPSEIVAVKLEVDTRPPPGAGLQTTVIRRHALLNLQHHDRSSLLAGKIHAILSREYLKGRDIYDLVWYLSDPRWPAPNLSMLNNALAQTGWDSEPLTARNWRQTLLTRLQQVDWEAAQQDVAPFLRRQEERAFISPQVVFPLLEKG